MLLHQTVTSLYPNVVYIIWLQVLSQALGQFFLYHIHLWVTYIMLVVPLITPYLHHLLPLLQLLPLSLQVNKYSSLFLPLVR